eukprot:s999_g3.t1
MLEGGTLLGAAQDKLNSGFTLRGLPPDLEGNLADLGATSPERHLARRCNHNWHGRDVQNMFGRTSSRKKEESFKPRSFGAGLPSLPAGGSPCRVAHAALLVKKKRDAELLVGRFGARFKLATAEVLNVTSMLLRRGSAPLWAKHVMGCASVEVEFIGA